MDEERTMFTRFIRSNRLNRLAVVASASAEAAVNGWERPNAWFTAHGA